MWRIKVASGQAAAKARRTRDAISMTRAPSFKSRRRMVLNSAVASACALGMASRTVSMSQQAAVCRISRIWLASGVRQLVRSEANCALCSLIRFSAWPRTVLVERPAGANVVGGLVNRAVEDSVAGQAEDEVDAVLVAPLHDFGPTVTPVTPDGDPGLRPVPADASDETA